MSVAVVEKAFALLEYLAEAGKPASLQEVTAASQLPKPTACRLLKSLQALGYVSRPAGSRAYLVGPRVSRLASVDPHADLKSVALPIMRRIHSEFNETVNLGILIEDRICYLEFIETTRPLRLVVRPNEGDPVHCTALGRAILSVLPKQEFEDRMAALRLEPRTAKTVTSREKLLALIQRARRVGYAREDEETNEGVVCLAFSLASFGHPEAAVSVSVPTPRAGARRIQKIIRSFPTTKAGGTNDNTSKS